MLEKKISYSIETNEIVQTITANEFNSKVFPTLPLPLSVCERACIWYIQASNIPMTKRRFRFTNYFFNHIHCTTTTLSISIEFSEQAMH